MGRRRVAHGGPARQKQWGVVVTRIADLSPRQQEVARLIAEGKFTAEIAEILQIEPKTADTHRAAVLSRLRLRNNVELCLKAIGEGVIAAPVPIRPVPDHVP